MSDVIPPPEPDKKPAEPLPARNSAGNAPPSRGACAGIGVALLVGSIVFAFLFPPIAVLGLIGAVMTLFFEGYRYIFVGYILGLLIGAGLAFLVLIIACGNMGHM